ncbi:MAG: cell wall hydrolase [Micavibrio aeruginosavorus]|uniref:Cell wall hydrolase n=1 Tax=Micavibrio aeruginosavorus TaxID=349221 RepID=A0A2W5HT56_9BACT|nr:MAG: cell wall hydrolase [Micavibrio aeruginosavorus]
MKDTIKPGPKLFPLPNAADENASKLYSELEIDVLARTIWGEARGEGLSGMNAVACVILNRVEAARKLGGYWWGNTILQVCQKPYQFSCWNKNDANYQKLVSVDEEDMHFVTAKRTARRAMLGFLKDETKGATHYHARNILPDWAKDRKLSAMIGRHVFYKLIEV